jgi:hypothetical protein
MGFGYENLKISDASKNLEMARQSLVEEIIAINMYRERIELTKDKELKKLLVHNETEEKEHAAMLFQYMMKRDRVQSQKFRKHD